MNVPVQVAGGIRTDERVDRWLDAGAARVVVGTRAILDEPWLRAQAGRHEGRVVVAADVRGGRIATHGWTQSTALAIDAFLDSVACAPLAGVLVTDIDREGRMGGADVALFERLAAATPHPLIASGGITGPADLTALAAGGVAGAVLGMALYTGAFPSYPILRRNP